MKCAVVKQRFAHRHSQENIAVIHLQITNQFMNFKDQSSAGSVIAREVDS